LSVAAGVVSTFYGNGAGLQKVENRSMRTETKSMFSQRLDRLDQRAVLRCLKAVQEVQAMATVLERLLLDRLSRATNADRFLKPEEVAKLLQVPKARVYTLARQGQLPKFDFGPESHRVRIPASALAVNGNHAKMG
jgi:helix-turn-helix protein